MELNLDTLPKKGEVVTYKHRGVSFTMQIANARIRYGKIDVALTPLAGMGTGSFWVRFDGLKTGTVGQEVFKDQELVDELETAEVIE